MMDSWGFPRSRDGYVLWRKPVVQPLLLILSFAVICGRYTSHSSDGDGAMFDLVVRRHPHRTSRDLDMDPCKAGRFEGDIILNRMSEDNRHGSVSKEGELSIGNSTDRRRLNHCRRNSKRHRSHRHQKRRRRRKNRAATARKDRLWSYGVIPYEIEANFSGEHRTLFKQAMRYWENSTCIQFVEKTSEHPNFIFFTQRSCGCCSFVGRRGNGGQAISIGKNCDKFGIVVHELGHVIGFWHEHTRPDRDKHVQIINKNIMSGQEYNFNKLTEEEVNSLGLSYDYDSIMHYARNTFSKSTELDTILPKGFMFLKPVIGQRVRLSKGDVAQTNRLYKCPSCGRTLLEPSGQIISPSTIPEGLTCQWRIASTHGEKIYFNLTSLDIFSTPLCDSDYVEVRDGYWVNSPLLGRFCGSSLLKEFLMSTGHRMLVTYKASPGHSIYGGFKATYEAVCGGVLRRDEGILQSPNYPDDYRPNKECIWSITVPERYQVALDFEAFEIEHHDNCAYDYVELRDGLSLASPLLARLCGNKIPDEVRSTSNAMLVRFISDSSVQKMGFSASFVKEIDECQTLKHGCQHTCVNTVGGYKCECHIGFELHSDGKTCEDACGGVLSSANGYIRSPSFPDLYPTNKHCAWEIIAPEKFTITLDFTHFDLEGTNLECEYDRVDIYSVLNGKEEIKHGSFCGTRLPPVVTSEGKIMKITFDSDNSVQKSGFAAVYSTDKNECSVGNGGCQHICKNTIGSYQCSCHNGFVLHSNKHDCKEGNCVYFVSATSGTVTSPNYPEPYPSRKDCTWHFTTKNGHRIKVVYEDFEVESHQECAYDKVVFYDGPTSNAPDIANFCGSRIPYPVISASNTLTMSFLSDPSVQKRGFKATYTTVCGGRVTATEKVFQLYSHPKFGDQNYDNGLECNWFVTSLNNRRIKVDFESFDLEPENDCNYDYVTVFDGYEGSPLMGKYCGNTVPLEMASTGPRLLVRLTTDDTINRKGFSLNIVEEGMY